MGLVLNLFIIMKRLDAKLRLNVAFRFNDSISTAYIWTHPPNENITHEADYNLGKCGKFITQI